MSGPLRTGTAGWSIAAADAAHFGGEGSHLERYARVFDATEINSSFHRPHRRETYQRWAASVPDDFRFSVKCPRAATHDLRLVGCGEVLRRFAAEVAGLDAKLAVVLVQLPPSLVFDPPVAAGFLGELAAMIPASLACEPRHASWFEQDAEMLLAENGVARVAADPAKPAGADIPGGDGRLVYYRLHGSPRIYRSAYGPQRCGEVAQRLVASAAKGASVWCIFDNTASSAAIGDALLTRAAAGV